MLVPCYHNQSRLYTIARQGAGAVPKELLQSLYTSEAEAQKAINSYTEKANNTPKPKRKNQEGTE